MIKECVHTFNQHKKREKCTEGRGSVAAAAHTASGPLALLAQEGERERRKGRVRKDRERERDRELKIERVRESEGEKDKENRRVYGGLLLHKFRWSWVWWCCPQ